jgi:hypothetical protein
LKVELDQHLGCLAAHRIAGACRPDGLAVELEVAEAGRRGVRVEGGVDGSLRFGPKLLATALEGHEALSTAARSESSAETRLRTDRWWASVLRAVSSQRLAYTFRSANALEGPWRHREKLTRRSGDDSLSKTIIGWSRRGYSTRTTGWS